VRASIKAVVRTLLEATALVVLVVILFLQTWRASIIPLVAVPVSIVGTFSLLYLFGFSINALSLFGLVLAIGIVVDDAIVVVENVERNIEEGLSPLAAAHQAMTEVSGPIVAIALVLCAVFVPMAFLDGVVGQFYKQFAVTIAISTVISAINSLTLSPALAALLLKSHDAPKDMPSRLIDRLFGWLFRPFNRIFKSSSNGYQGAVSRTLHRRGAVFAVYVLLLAAAGFMFQTVPGGFIPSQDKGFLISGTKLPEGASLSRTDAVLRRISEAALEVDGVDSTVSFPGLNALQFTNTPNTGVSFIVLKPFSERHRSAAEINAEINQKIAGIKEGFAFSFLPPAVFGLGSGSGYSLYVEDRAGLGYGALQNALGALQGTIMQTPGMTFPISTYQSNVPQLDLQVDRVKAKAQGVALTELFDTVQTYLGSTYVNDFNRFGRTFRVFAQADGPYRESVEDIAKLRTRNNRGEMVPIGSMVRIDQTFGPDPVMRYNGYPAIDVIGDADPRLLSSAEAMAKVSELAAQVLPNGMVTEWTDLSFQQSTQGNAALFIFPLSVMLAFLVLDASPGRGADRAHVHAIGIGRRLADRRRQQRVRPGRPRRADGIGVQERHPDRRIRPRTGNPGQGHRRSRARSVPSPATSDHHDVDRVHRRHRAAARRSRCWRGSARSHRRHRVRRHAGRDLVRPVPDAGVLCRAAKDGAQDTGCLERAQWPGEAARALTGKPVRVERGA
jgi:multidrug efflux pump